MTTKAISGVGVTQTLAPRPTARGADAAAPAIEVFSYQTVDRLEHEHELLRGLISSAEAMRVSNAQNAYGLQNRLGRIESDKDECCFFSAADVCALVVGFFASFFTLDCC